MCDNPPNIDFYQRIFTCILLSTKFDIFISDKFYTHKLVSLYHHHKFGFWNLVPSTQGWVRPKPDPKFGPRALGFEWPDPIWARFWVARPSSNQKKLHFQLKIWSKMGQNRPKSVARTGPWPKKASPSPTQAKKGQPDLGQKKSGPTQPYLRLICSCYTSRFSILLMISISQSQIELLRVGLVWAILT